MRKILFIAILSLLFSCRTTKEQYNPERDRNIIPITSFNHQATGKAPNYEALRYWAAHPDKSSIPLPKNLKEASATTLEVDVFFVHPTLYFEGKQWNANIDDQKLNETILVSSIQNQASVFSEIGEVYAPHYRQMHIYGYTDTLNGKPAFDLAYRDVKAAFLKYWKNWNNNKPFIIAGHSQGTNHAERLLKEVILPNSKMQERLLLAYLPGMPILPFSDVLPPCEEANQLHCFLSWRTFAEDYTPPYAIGKAISSINPISWSTDTLPSELESHLGILFPNNKIRFKKSVTAYNHKGILWMKPLHIPLARLYSMNNYHIADYNLFWRNIRENLKERLQHTP